MEFNGGKWKIFILIKKKKDSVIQTIDESSCEKKKVLRILVNRKLNFLTNFWHGSKKLMLVMATPRWWAPRWLPASEHPGLFQAPRFSFTFSFVGLCNFFFLITKEKYSHGRKPTNVGRWKKETKNDLTVTI